MIIAVHQYSSIAVDLELERFADSIALRVGGDTAGGEGGGMELLLEHMYFVMWYFLIIS